MANIDRTVTEEGIRQYALGNGASIDYIEEKVVGATSDIIVLTKTLPARSRILMAYMVFDGAITLATAVKVGLGISSDTDSILLSGTTMTDGTVTDGVPLTTQYVSAATAVQVTACATGGTAAGTFTGTVKVKIVYATMDAPA